MDTLHLLWIVPLSAAVGFVIAAFVRAVGEADVTYNSVNIEEEQNK